MARKPEAERGGAAQSQRFVETARALGCDEDESAFDEKLKKLATPRPKPPATSPPGEKPRDE